MPEERLREDLGMRKARLLVRSEYLRERCAGLWSELDRPLRVMEDGGARLRRNHLWTAGTGVANFLLLRRKPRGKRRLLGPLLSLGSTTPRGK